jgi:predicted ester cyclase
MLQHAFRAQFTIEVMSAEGDKVVVRWTNHLVQQGEFMGIPPGISATISGVNFHVLRSGKMAEHWDIVDTFRLLQQLGVLPQPTSPQG